VAVDYASKRVEAKALCTNIAVVIKKFLYENIFTRFGFPLTLVSDQGVHLINVAIEVLTTNFLMKHTSSTTYYLQGNDQVELTNKVIDTLLTKLVNEKQSDWDEHLHTILYAYRTTFKVTIEHTWYELVYGLHPLMLMEYLLLANP